IVQIIRRDLGKTSRHPSHGCLSVACVRNVLRACSHAVSMSSTSQTRPRALAHCNTASFPKEPCSFLLDIPSPFLLGLSLLKGPCSQRMSQGASTGSGRLHRAWLLSPASASRSSPGSLVGHPPPVTHCWRWPHRQSSGVLEARPC